MLIQQNIPLAPLTTFRVGGPALYFASAQSEDDVLEAIAYARERALPLFVLGGGSNLVVSGAGFRGLVLHVALKGVESRSQGVVQMFHAAAGEEWDALVERAVAEDCAGIECLSGIPGMVGATPVQNVGAYGQEVAETIRSVRVLDLYTMEVLDLPNQECGFGYRTSIFNTTEKGRYIVLKVTFGLLHGGVPRVEYADLKRHFEGRDTEQAPALRDVREAVRAIRHRKGMLLVEGEPDCRSAGSFFKNPIVSQQQADALTARAEAEGKQLPRYAAGNGQVKVSAAWLVEQAGFGRGTARGNVGISRRHSLALITREGATAADLVAFKDEITAGVLHRFGIELHPEPVFVGF